MKAFLGACAALLLATAAMMAPAPAEAAICQYGPPAPGAAGGDVSLTIGGQTYYATKCADFSVSPSNPTSEIAAINDAFGTSFVYLDKTDDNDRPVGFGGVRFVVTSNDVDDPNGAWTFKWIDTAGAPDLPLLTHLAVLLKASTQQSAYLIEDVLLPVTPNTGTGSFEVSIQNNKGNYRDLSHLLVGGAYSTVSVPEPAALALFGTGLLGLGLARKLRNGASDRARAGGLAAA